MVALMSNFNLLVFADKSHLEPVKAIWFYCREVRI